MAEGTLSLRKKPDSAPSSERGRRDHVEKRAKSLKAQRSGDEDDWHSIADFSGYGEIPGLRVKSGSGGRRPKMRQLIDSYPILSFRTIEGGMYSGLSSPNRPWFDFSFADPELNEYAAAREWKDQFQSIIYRMFDASNFYQVARQNYGEMARFGPACGLMTEHPIEVAPCLAQPIGTFWLGFNSAFGVDTLLRDCPMTVDQIVEKFVAGPGGRMNWSAVSTYVKNQWYASNYDTVVHCKQLIEPGSGLRFDATIWDEKDDRKNAVLEAKWYGERPFWGPRWNTRDGSGYGRGVGHDALGDMRELAMQAKRKRELTDLLAKPPTAGVARDLDMRPGAHTHVADLSAVQAAKPIYEVNPQALSAVREDIREIKEQIDRLTYADLFMAITNMPGVQPRNIEEILKRDEEKLSQIGPVVEMVNDDMLPIAVERIISIAERGGLIPEAPEELQGRELKVEFVSILSMAQKMLGLSSTERVVGFVGSLGQVFGPQVLDKIDPDAIIDDYAERANLPASAIRDSAMVEQMRKSRQQQEQMAEMAALASPAKDATTAAQNIAEMSNDGARF
ncbi:portal protein [Qipengyuania pacifica]|uniref:portal protein n=1 Tax=Qipengyuania pacifica TaxID=2860199 RepID=UPI001C9D7E6C|nr:portal protein [Qipengyuania pacifica]MBY8333122.1 hypothetical protein [Qipengyuania pacifica]